MAEQEQSSSCVWLRKLPHCLIFNAVTEINLLPAGSKCLKLIIINSNSTEGHGVSVEGMELREGGAVRRLYAWPSSCLFNHQ